jgi:hypothetical protein
MFLTWIISIAFSIWLFWIGFGIYMTAGSNQECFPVYFSMWPTLILVIFSFFSPRIGGALLMGNAVNFSILFFIETFCVPGLSVPSVIHNFIVYSQKYYFFLNILTISGLMMLLGCSFFFIVSKQRSSFMKAKKTP